MADNEWLAAAFAEHRDHLRAVAYRLLGSMADADDAVQDTWLRLTGADTSDVENLGGWLTTLLSATKVPCAPSASGIAALIRRTRSNSGPTPAGGRSASVT